MVASFWPKVLLARCPFPSARARRRRCTGVRVRGGTSGHGTSRIDDDDVVVRLQLLVDDPKSCVQSVKQRLHNKEGIPSQQQRLVFPFRGQFSAGAAAGEFVAEEILSDLASWQVRTAEVAPRRVIYCVNGLDAVGLEGWPVVLAPWLRPFLGTSVREKGSADHVVPA